jgi:hypothetical protein
MRENCLQNTFSILQYLMIPEAKHIPAPARQIGVSCVVATTFGMLETVSLDDQLSADAKKVDNIRSDWNLPAET